MRALALLALTAALAGCGQIVEPTLVVTVHAPEKGVVGPVQGAQVLLSDDIHGGLTDGDGRVAMYGVEAGAYNVTVRWDGQEHVRRVHVNGSTAEVAFLLNETQAPHLEVQVFSTQACEGCGGGPAPAAGAIVLLSDNVHGGRTGPDGRFAFFDLQEGAYTVTVLWLGEEQSEPVVLGAGEEPPVVRFTFHGSSPPEQQAA